MQAIFRSSLFLALCLVVALAGCAPQATTPVPAADPFTGSLGAPYTIGFVVSVTGGASFLGEPQRDTAAMLQKQFDAQGGGVESTTGFIGVDGIFNLSSEDHVGLSADDVVLARITTGEWEYFPPEKW